jgi:hypothetical protein
LGNQYINILKLTEIKINAEIDTEIDSKTIIRYKKGKLRWIINEKLNIEVI